MQQHLSHWNSEKATSNTNVHDEIVTNSTSIGKQNSITNETIYHIDGLDTWNIYEIDRTNNEQKLNIEDYTPNHIDFGFVPTRMVDSISNNTLRPFTMNKSQIRSLGTCKHDKANISYNTIHNTDKMIDNRTTRKKSAKCLCGISSTTVNKNITRWVLIIHKIQRVLQIKRGSGN